MSLWSWVTGIPGQTVATLATAATARGAKDRLSQLSQLSQGFSAQQSRSLGRQPSQVSQLSQPVETHTANTANTDNADDAREAWEERAAIMEFDGGMTRVAAESAAAAGEVRPDTGGVDPWCWPFDEWADLRPCLLCRNLTPAGRCLAAWRDELRAARDYTPTFPELPRRCIGYCPKDDDPDRRPGCARWPELVESQSPEPVAVDHGAAPRGVKAKGFL